MKSVSKKLSEASEVAALLRLNNSDVEYFSIGWGVSCKLTQAAFRRVFLNLKLSRSRLKANPDWIGSDEVRFSFDYRGCDFWTLVKADVIDSWRIDSNGAKDHPALLPGKPRKRIGFAAPEVIDVQCT